MVDFGVLALVDCGVDVAFAGEGVREVREFARGVEILVPAMLREALLGVLEGSGLGVLVCLSFGVVGVACSSTAFLLIAA